VAAPLAAAGTEQDDDLTDLSIEQLSNVIVTSLSRQQERLSNAAAAIYIINAGDIRRSGARSLPDALRLAPNLHVARVDARNYAISARGFNSAFSNKLLVLIDGRSVYSPLFSGVFWDAQDVVMEDIERIEVISGPGATIWGANAVNGVINVITRSARDSVGGLASATVGAHEKDATLRYGSSLPNGGHYRLYARAMEQDDTRVGSGLNTETGMRRVQAGFRADVDVGRGALTVSGDAYDGALGQIGTRDIAIAGANLIGRYTRKLQGDADLRLQLVLDHTERNQPNAFVERLDTVELEAQHGVRLGTRHNLAWGGGYRHAWDDAASGPAFGFLPNKLQMHSANVFAQDEMALSDALRVTAGVKVEHNNYTGAEWLPSVRVAWNLDSTQLLWSSLARTVRAPSRTDRDLYAPPAPVLIGGQLRYLLAGGPDFDSEVAKVFEVGYRAQPAPNLSYAVTAFYGDYDRLRTQEPLPVFGYEFRNMGMARTRGVELWARWQPAPRWSINGGLVAQSVQIRGKPGSRDPGVNLGLGTSDPNSHWLLRLSHEVSDTQQLDFTLRRSGKMRNPAVPAYHELDLHWVWRPRRYIDVALIGENLLHRRHGEFAAEPGRSVFERRALLKMTLRF